ncbi:hypothetical protein FN846DRAFT_786629 [Sphaerosporella brunnea]|uniref:ubiquitinyl hydrolase 1 n=1 Tax=Sphaerosporella brunnea TaxID=1250544 RepID=A0A5J5EF31_9PEZI|nr:hypothetical protein FN846DRAFT_786629 [Sphaerosporella brunnea]
MLLTGKIPTRLFADLLVYDPTRTGRNVLCEPPPYVHESVVARQLPPQPHKHQLSLKSTKNSLPRDGVSETSEPWMVSALCQTCRLHVRITVDSSQPSLSESEPCSEGHNPMHFFRYEPSKSRPITGEILSTERWEDVRVFSCAATKCPTIVTVTTKAPILHQGFVELLTDEGTLMRRAMAFGETQGRSYAGADVSAYKSLKALFSYLSNAKHLDTRDIPRGNPKYLSLLSDECREIMKAAHFKEKRDGSLVWTPISAAELEKNSLAAQDLYDMLEEVMILMDNYRPQGQGERGLFRTYIAGSTELMFKRTMPSRHPVNRPDLPEHPYYAVLGLVPEVGDRIVSWAYNRQQELNPDDLPFYFECFKLLASGRNSEALQVEVATLQSQGAFTTSDLTEAYKALGINPNEPDEELIIGIFRSRLQDSPRQESSLRSHLNIIGTRRQSDKLKAASRARIGLAGAYAWLGEGTGQATDDAVILTAYQLKIEDNPNDEATGKECLKIIAENRKSPLLLTFLETNGAVYDIPPDLDAAYAALQASDRSLSDDLLIDVFKIRVLDAPDRLSDLRVALRVIADNRNSTKIKEFLETGDTETAAMGSSTVPVGLENIGNTCYLNSLLQFYFTIKPLREMVLEYEKHQEEEVADAFDDAASETTLVSETPPQDVSMVDPALREVGKENMPPPSNEEALEPPSAPSEDVTMTTDDDKVTLVGESPLTPPPEDSQPPPIPKRPTARRDTVSEVDMFGRQQDVTECIGNVMFQLEAAIKAESVDENGEQIDLIKRLFYGKTRQTLAFPDSAEVRTKDEFFSHLIVDVADGDRDLYTALDANFDVEQVDLEGRHAKRYLSVTNLPPILQFQVQRVQFSREQNAAYKSNARLKFPYTIFMDRYRDDDDGAIKARREQSWKWKEELKQLLLRKEELSNLKMPGGALLESLCEYIEERQTDGTDASDPDDSDDEKGRGDALACLQKRLVDVHYEIAGIDKKIKALENYLNQQFTDLRKYGYHIHSVFIHRGSVSFGHYWIYIWDFEKKVFRKYNDQYVSEVVDSNEVFTHSDTDSSPPTPYFLVFVREDLALDTTEAVKRVFAET